MDMSTLPEKKNYKYCYDYPEQRNFFNKLDNSDLTLIAKKTGFTRQYIGMMASGKRKITPEAQKLAEKLSGLREEMNNVEI
jgi:hypothetical protein